MSFSFRAFIGHGVAVVAGVQLVPAEPPSSLPPSGRLAAAQPGGPAAGRQGRRVADPQEASAEHAQLRPRAAEEHALEAPRATSQTASHTLTLSTVTVGSIGVVCRKRR